MKTFVADIIPKIQRFSRQLDDLTLLTNQHWVSLGEINHLKKVFIFRANKQLLISIHGMVEKCSWEYLGNQSILVENNEGTYLMRQGFFDENVLALKLDNGANEYAFFVNESKYQKELNTITDVLKFLEERYSKQNYQEQPSTLFNKNDIIEPIEISISDEQKIWMTNANYCPACGFKGVKALDTCPDCGLTLK